jgi:hypothetical protein
MIRVNTEIYQVLYEQDNIILIPAIAFLVEAFCPHRSEADLILRTQHRRWLPLSNLGLPFNATAACI